MTEMYKTDIIIQRGTAQKEKFMEISEFIKSGKAVIGIEFGSTRIKAVLVGEDNSPLASGFHDWQNSLDNGVWTYPLDEVKTGLQDCFGGLMKDVKDKFGVELASAAGFGISAMMHGYLAFDENRNLLVPFRTWRNTMTGEAAEKLTAELGFNIPQRWSIAHLYQAILNNESHISKIAHITTLAGYVHFLLTGENVLGAGDASGMFPLDEKGGYDAKMAARFDELTKGTAFDKPLLTVLPGIVKVGECAGTLTDEGAKLLDPTGVFGAGVPFCPPEGDAQTGMVATNSIVPKTGNVSAGTSIFAMIVLEKALAKVHREIDIVTTPDGDPVAMVHCNNCSTDLDAWVNMFGGLLKAAGCDMPKPKLYDTLYALAAEGEPDCGGIVSYNYYAGEEITGLTAGKPMIFRDPEAKFTIQNLMRSLVYSCYATLKLGMDILTKEENVKLERLYAHGGLFKTPVPSQNILSAALGADVTLMKSAGEGGAWGIALLAAYMTRVDKSQSLKDFLAEKVFKGAEGSTVSPDERDAAGVAAFMSAYKAGIAAEKAACGQ